MSSLRMRFWVLIGATLVAAVALQLLAVNAAQGWTASDGVGQPGLVVPTILSTLATFCVATAIALVLGIVALYVIDEVYRHRTATAADVEGTESTADDGPAAYGSDPELL
jgi:ABC-type phosphate transport system permease subunit